MLPFLIGPKLSTFVADNIGPFWGNIYTYMWIMDSWKYVAFVSCIEALWMCHNTDKWCHGSGLYGIHTWFLYRVVYQSLSALIPEGLDWPGVKCQALGIIGVRCSSKD